MKVSHETNLLSSYFLNQNSFKVRYYSVLSISLFFPFIHFHGLDKRLPPAKPWAYRQEPQRQWDIVTFLKNLSLLWNIDR